MMAEMKRQEFCLTDFLHRPGPGRTTAKYRRRETIFAQGDPSDCIYYLREGRVKLTVLSRQGKEAIIAMLGTGSFLGEECLTGKTTNPVTATAMTPVSALKIHKKTMEQTIEDESVFARFFTSYLLSRKARIEEDLIDHLFNSSEKRLARTLLLLAGYPGNDASTAVLPKISQETLAEMVGTTRSRVSFFMNRFRKAGFVEYGDTIQVRSTLLNFVLRD